MELTLPQRAAVALKSNDIKAQIATIVAETSAIKQVTNDAGRKQCHSAMMRLVKIRTGVTSAGKNAREDATKFSKAIIAEEKDIIALSEPEEKRLKKMCDDYDDIERNRVLSHTSKIADIKHMPLAYSDSNAEELSLFIFACEMAYVDHDFEEFADEATAVREAAITRLTTMRDEAKQREEADAARVALDAQLKEREIAIATRETELARFTTMRDEAKQREEAESIAPVKPYVIIDEPVIDGDDAHTQCTQYDPHVSSTKSCVFCKFFDLYMGEPAYYDDPSAPASIKCRIGRWSMCVGEDDDHTATFRRYVTNARMCGDYSVIDGAQ